MAGLPQPGRRAAVRAPNGRYFLDADWPDRRLSAEVHGRHHLVADTLEHDWRRHNELTIGGRRVLHFTSHSVRREKAAVIAVLSRAWNAAAR
jgi:very-short-patch-repair endonuclease